jgi:hypothetical protein
MGDLTPGATYIYERYNGKIYAREVGKKERTVIGYDNSEFKGLYSRYFTIWNDILLESEGNPVLSKAIENVIMLYRLSKDDPK